jgi:peptidyl-prolyl cis-trans isomerase D
VKAQVAQHWRDDEIASRLKAKADDMLGKLKGGEAFDALATADKLKLQTAADLKRGGTSGAITPRMTEAIFQTAKDAYGDAAGDAPTQRVIFRVNTIKTPALDANSQGAKATAQTIERQIADDLVGQYMAWLENYLGTNINGAALAQAIGNSSNGPLGQN